MDDYLVADFYEPMEFTWTKRHAEISERARKWLGNEQTDDDIRPPTQAEWDWASGDYGEGA